MAESNQHKCPSCGEPALGYVGAVPLGRCRACGKSFEPRDFLPKLESEPSLEELLERVDTSLDKYNSDLDTFEKHGFVLLSALVRKVRRLEETNDSLREGMRSHAENIKRLKGIP